MCDKIKTYHVDKLINNAKMDKKLGQFINENEYKYIFDTDVDVYDENGKLLVCMRKKIIPENITKLAKKHYMNEAKKSKTTSRGYASGKVDIKNLSSNVLKVMNPERCKSKIMFKNGKITNYSVCNKVNSMIVGYYDKPILKKYKKMVKKGRETAFTLNKSHEWNGSLPFIEYADYIFEKVHPEQYKKQKEFIKDIDEEFMIGNTIFTTVTINYNFRTATHKDTGNLEDAYSVFTVCEQGEWKGCYLGYPQYGICLNVREGDFVLMNPHLHHSNTEFKDTGEDFSRKSFVMYARKGFLK